MAKLVRARTTLSGLAILTAFALTGKTAEAQMFPASDSTAAYLVFPKVVVDITAASQALQKDTLIQLTNTSPIVGRRIVQCFYIDAVTWDEVDFTLELSQGQPTAWRVSEGASVPFIPARFPQFTGELKCVEVDTITTPVPVSVNDIKGEATIYTVSSGSPGSVDIRSYNAIGLQALNVSPSEPPSAIGRKCRFGTNPGAPCTSDANCTGGGTCQVLMCLGATTGSGLECPSGNYVSCPSTLILNNFFEDALDPVSGKPITTDITFVPCTEDLAIGTLEAQPLTRVQFLIFNEFEQRMSTATQVQCYRETRLANIDAKVGSEAASVFNVGVQGTLVGQTRIRPVTDSHTDHGHGLLAIAEEFHGSASIAFNVHEVGLNQGKGDFVRYLP